MNDSEYQRYWHCLMPGIKAYIKKIGGNFEYNGFVPCVIVNRKKHEICMARVISFAKEDKYEDINQYLSSLVHPSIIA